ncbi:MAG: sigma-54 dependent transcriptional regulator [bacterium]|jgi:two-component system response regulator PilR (NtrC family)
MPRILLIDDEPRMLSLLNTILKGEGYTLTPVQDSSKVPELLNTEIFDLMITDIRMTPIDGLELLKKARQVRPSMPVIILTAYGSVETAIEAMKLGTFDYVTKPFKMDELLITIQRALEYSRALSENIELKEELVGRYKFENIVAESAAMRNVCEMIKRVAPADTTVLITGESGTGKELVAKAIHLNSRRKDKRFVAVNCAALPEALLESEMFGHMKGAFTGASSNKDGLFETANGGTLFLDEIPSMPLSIQGKLLRVLQEKEIRRVGGNDDIQVDVRVIAATNTSLEAMIKKGTFREDLYYRLSVIPIDIKPLRERQEDVLPLVYHVLRNETGEGREIPKLMPEVRDILERYSWPGNVRELENAMKHAITFAQDNKITLEVLPPRILNQVKPVERMGGAPEGAADTFKNKSLKTFLREREKEYLEQVLAASKGDKEKAAKSLKISLATLYRKLPEE